MERLNVARLKEDLVHSGFTPEESDKVEQAIQANLPERTYNAAVLSLGIATIALVVGGILLAAIGKEVPDALWGALGAGIGGLAGIFMGNQ